MKPGELFMERLCCPSQGYFYFQDEHGGYWILYTRWRSMPWTAELMPVDNMEDDNWDWDNKIDVPIKTWPDEEQCYEAFKEAYEWVKDRFKNINLPDYAKLKIVERPFPEIDIEGLLGK